VVEECICCSAFAPGWDSDDYGDWVLELTPEGSYLGAVCPGCFAGEGLAFLDVEVASAVVIELPERRRARRQHGSSLAEAA